MRRTALALALVAFATVGCGSSGDVPPKLFVKTPAPTAAVTSTTRPVVLVGRWELNRTCQVVVRALHGAGLDALAPGVVGDYFPGASPQELAHKKSVCQGAAPQRHSHFFTADGNFGSLDQNEKQVDDVPYRAAGTGTFYLGEDQEQTFTYRIEGGDHLTMDPVISERVKRVALAHPLGYSTASHQVAVALSGQTWNRVPCGTWC